MDKVSGLDTMEEEAVEVKRVNDVDSEVSVQSEQPQGAKTEKSLSVKKEKKHAIAKARIAQAEETISNVDSQIEECMQRVEADLAQFKLAEEVLVEQGLSPARQMLKTLGVTEKLIQNAPVPKLDLEDPKLQPVEIKRITSGKGGGFMWGLIGGVAALAGWCYAAKQALGLPMMPTKIPDMERIYSVLGWTAKQIGQGENVSVGATVVGISFLLIVWVIYRILTALRGSKNLKVAEKIEADTEFYCTQKEECKEQMKKVREHIAHAQKTVEKYEVLLAEQNASLKRALFIEEVDGYDQLHAKSKATAQALQHLADEIEAFLETPMAEHGILSKEGIEVLERVNKSTEEHIKKLYEERG